MQKFSKFFDLKWKGPLNTWSDQMEVPRSLNGGNGHNAYRGK